MPKDNVSQADRRADYDKQASADKHTTGHNFEQVNREQNREVEHLGRTWWGGGGEERGGSHDESGIGHVGWPVGDAHTVAGNGFCERRASGRSPPEMTFTRSKSWVKPLWPWRPCPVQENITTNVFVFMT